MEHNLESIYSKHVIINGGEFIGLAFLAVVGAVSIVSNIANGAYQHGRDTKEAEMKREFKRYLKKLKKRGS